MTAAPQDVLAKNETSALELQRQFGFGSYETAWVWLHRLRRAMVRPDRDLLGGPGVTVELDETLVGGRSRGGRAARCGGMQSSTHAAAATGCR